MEDDQVLVRALVQLALDLTALLLGEDVAPRVTTEEVNATFAGYWYQGEPLGLAVGIRRFTCTNHDRHRASDLWIVPAQLVDEQVGEASSLQEGRQAGVRDL